MSRFFAAGSDSSDASDDDASFSDASSDASSLEVQEVKKNPFLRDAAASSDSDSEGERKLLKSSKLKLLEQQRKITASLNDALDSQDYVAAVQLNDKMIKLLKQEPPRFYIRFLVRLADEIAKAHKFSNQLNAKAYNVLKQKIKKSPFLDQMDSFRNNPVTELDSADEADESAKDNQKQSVTFEKVATDKLTSVQLFERLAEIIQARGKKNTDKALQIENLVLLLSQSTTPYQKIKCLLALIPARFDLVPQNTAIMSTEIWKQCIGEVKLLHDLLDENDHIIVGDFPENDELEAEHTRDKRITSGDSVSLNGIISSFVDRLDDEFFKSLQNIDPHTLEYVARLKDELFLYAMIFRAEKYSQRVGAPPQVLDLLKMRRVEHLYFKPDVIIESFINYTQSLYPLLFGDDSKTSLVTELCTELYKTTIDRIKIRALLCHVYHIAMHDKHQEARNMMLMSHLQETISKSDIQTQALYNRTIVQLGLCAFRAGLFWEAHTYLQEIASCGKTKELLAQGMSSQRNIEKSIEQEKIEKQRQLPFHMHVNLELLDSVYLTSAMFLEVPHAALNTSDSQRRPISKSFRRMIDYYERQIFTGKKT
jgi:translation initiation factor 3 subunit C